MKTTTDTDEIFKLLGEVKSQGAQFVTNYFLPKEKTRFWIDQGALSHQSIGGVLFVFRRCGDFYHLYYAAPNMDALNGGLGALLKGQELTLSSDLLGRDEFLKPTVALFERNGFEAARRICRFTKIGGADVDMECPGDDDVVFGQPGDAEEVWQILSSIFDPYSESIPTVEEIAEVIADDGVILAKREGKTAGLMLFEKWGSRWMANYWIVLDGQQGYGIGSKLWTRYTYESRNAKRLVLWVTDDNQKVIDHHMRYAYKLDGLVDIVMVRKKGTR